MMRMTPMRVMNLTAIDMNLLVALDAFLAERSVTAAAKRLSISQPAASHQLARLRDVLGDALLVRTRQGMVPTPRAEALAGPLRTALATLEGALGGGGVWDPSTAERSFSVGTTDYAELVLLPALVARLRKDAPSVDIFVRTLDEDIAAQLASGKVDVAIAPPPQVASEPSIHTTELLTERFVCVMREGHPLAKKRLTLDRFCAASHALVAPRGKPGGLVDEALARLGRSRRVALTVPHFLVAPHVLVESDLVLTLAERVARTFAGLLPLVTAEPPIELSGFTMTLAWHERTQADPGQAWLRGLLVDLAATMRRPRKRPPPPPTATSPLSQRAQQDRGRG